MEIMDIAKKCRTIFNEAAETLGNDLAGYSALDLCADNIPNVSLDDLMCAITYSGIESIASERIQKQIAGYARKIAERD